MCVRSIGHEKSASYTAAFLRKGLLIPPIFSAPPEISALDDWEALKEHGEGVCDSCMSKAEESNEQSRREIWSRLPSFFGLPDWKELLKSELTIS